MATRNRGPEFCSNCGKELRDTMSFAFRPRGAAIGDDNGEGGGIAIKCLPCSLLHRPMLKRSAIAAVVVGTILTALNQGDLLISGQWTPALYWKIPLTYCVPFLVATYGALTNSRR